MRAHPYVSVVNGCAFLRSLVLNIETTSSAFPGSWALFPVLILHVGAEEPVV